LKNGKYTSFLNAQTTLPMMYMPDALKATINLMEAPAEKVKIRSSYNVAGMRFNPLEIAESIKKHIPNFEIDFNPDFRQAIADSWPKSINDDEARQHWGWSPDYDLQSMTDDMILNLRKRI
jgi:nucleoside-diphosphate-sugar epimerase